MKPTTILERMENIMKVLVLLVSCLLSSSSFAKCFEFSGNGPDRVGPVDFRGYDAETVCVNKINGFGGGHYYSVRFADDEGNIAQFASQTETLGRCPGFCRSYQLTSGNALGQNVDLDKTSIQFMVEPNGFPGKLTITYDDQSVEFELKNDQSPTSIRNSI
jgi:hypothetical protein